MALVQPLVSKSLQEDEILQNHVSNAFMITVNGTREYESRYQYWILNLHKKSYR
jgi:hypothetical protein